MLQRTKEKVIDQHVLLIVGLALVIIALGVFAFLNQRDTSPGVSQNLASAQSSIVPVTKITQGQKSIVTRRVNYLITSAEELTKLWKMVDATPPPPAIDFKKQAVLAIFAGSEPRASIAVSKVEDADKRVVSITLTKHCESSQALASSYEIVAVPATGLPLTHQDIATPASCPN